MKKGILIASLIMGLFMAMPTITQAQVVVKIKQPALKVIVKPKPTRSHYVWISGYWKWNKRKHNYLWIDGYWSKPKKGKIWVSGHHKQVLGGYTWVSGFWKHI